MRKRRRLLTPQKKSKFYYKADLDESNDHEVNTARGRLKGALLEALELQADDRDSYESPPKRERVPREVKHSETSEDEEKTAQRQSYVLKLFDRSVDLSQFEENAPLYPICRAWIINQPKANYKTLGVKKEEPTTEYSVELPGPDGEPISKIPDILLIQEQKKESINLNYDEAPAPSREQLLQAHINRWSAVRQAWMEQAARVERRYEASQEVLNSINVALM